MMRGVRSPSHPGAGSRQAHDAMTASGTDRLCQSSGLQHHTSLPLQEWIPGSAVAARSGGSMNAHRTSRNSRGEEPTQATARRRHQSLATTMSQKTADSSTSMTSAVARSRRASARRAGGAIIPARNPSVQAMVPFRVCS